MSAVPSPLPDGAACGVTRLLSPGVEAALEPFASSEVLSAGKVNLIAVDAVVERFGSRWPMRRDQVHEHVQGVLDRHLGARGFHLRISDTDVLVCQPELGRLAGQASCLRLLREILGHFLGASELAEIGVHEVLRVSPSGVEARALDPRAIIAADEQTEQTAESPSAGPLLGPVAVWTPFVASNGRSVEIACTLDPVMELRGRATIGLRFRRLVLDAATGRELSAAELERLSRVDRLRIDLGAVALGLDQLRSRRSERPPPTLILPVSFSSLTNLDDRARIVSAFQEARRYAGQGLICELRDIEGVPIVTLQAAVSMIAPHSLFVVGHVGDLTTAQGQHLRDAGLRGLSTDCPPGLEGAVYLGWVKHAALAAKRAARSFLLYRVPSVQQAMVAAAVGATHAHVLR